MEQLLAVQDCVIQMKITLKQQIMTKKDDFKENVLCLIAGFLLAAAFIAIACGDGDKGWLQLLLD